MEVFEHIITVLFFAGYIGRISQAIIFYHLNFSVSAAYLGDVAALALLIGMGPRLQAIVNQYQN